MGLEPPVSPVALPGCSAYRYAKWLRSDGIHRIRQCQRAIRRSLDRRIRWTLLGNTRIRHARWKCRSDGVRVSGRSFFQHFHLRSGHARLVNAYAHEEPKGRLGDIRHRAIHEVALVHWSITTGQPDEAGRAFVPGHLIEAATESASATAITPNDTPVGTSRISPNKSLAP